MDTPCFQSGVNQCRFALNFVAIAFLTLSAACKNEGKLGAMPTDAAPGAGGGSTSTPDNATCLSTRERYVVQVYGRAMVACRDCHAGEGIALQQGARFKMVREVFPNFVEDNIAAMKAFVPIEVDGVPLILRKALGERNHGGGAVLGKASDEFRILSAFVDDLRAGTPEKNCPSTNAPQVDLLSPRETLRKAALALAGRFPTDTEFDSVKTDADLESAVVKLTQEEPFYDRLKEVWNDVLLTDKGPWYQVLTPPTGTYGNYNAFDETVGESARREPLQFIEYVVRNNLPFSDVVSGQYVVVNPQLARMYGLDFGQTPSEQNFFEWKRIDAAPLQINTATPDQGDYYDGTPAGRANVAVSGILSTPAFLNAWPITATNRSRGRARYLLKTFLATDLLQFAKRPVDASALSAVQNPTKNAKQCTVCHVIIDPIAGGFRGFQRRGDRQTRFSIADAWYGDMLSPGFNGLENPSDDSKTALAWLGKQMATDPRFGIGIAHVMYRGLVGDEPMQFPDASDAPDHADTMRAYIAQSEWFAKLAQDFVKSQMNLRVLVAGIVKGPYFRAKSAAVVRDIVNQQLGQGRLLPPEMLGRKYRGTTGLFYTEYPGIHIDTNFINRMRGGTHVWVNDLVDFHGTDWRYIFGGIDSLSITKRAESINPMMAAAGVFTGAKVACRATSFDFTQPQAARRMFRQVERETTPFAVRKTKEEPLVAIAENEAKIRSNIQYLFWRLLGETHAVDSNEVSAVYALFVDTWKSLELTQLTQGNGVSLAATGCAANLDMNSDVAGTPLRARVDGAPYEPGMRLETDETFTVRAWQAVVTLMLIDFRFLYD